MKSLLLLVLITGLFQAPNAFADGVIRRIVVFPIKTDQPYGDTLDEAWFRMREELTLNHRFLVATKQFLIQKDVFQPRGSLSPADAVILGKLLDGQAIISTYIEDRQIYLNAYSGDDGTLLFDQHFPLEASLPAASQLVSICQKLMQDFVASIPYQAFVVRDPLEKGVVYRSGNEKLVKIEVGADSRAAVGDPVQFIRLDRKSMKPLFDEGGQVSVLAEGTISSVDKSVLTVRLTRATRTLHLAELDPALLPKENQRLRDEAGLFTGALNPYLVSKEMRVIDTQPKSSAKPYLTAVGFLSSIAAFLLLAL